RVVHLAARELKVDIVLFDSGPNIGALNKTILLDCDYFIIPAACDLFSLTAIKTLGQTLVNWLTDWRTIRALAPDGVYLPPGRPKFLGYITQRVRTYADHPTCHTSQFLPLITMEI